MSKIFCLHDIYFLDFVNVMLYDYIMNTTHTPAHVLIARFANAKGLRLSTDAMPEECYGLWNVASSDKTLLAEDLTKEECLDFVRSYPNVQVPQYKPRLKNWESY